MDEDTALTLDNHHVFTRWWLLGSEEEKEKKKKQNWPWETAVNHLCQLHQKKESDKEHGERQMWTHEQQLQFPLPFIVMTDLSTESDRGTLWSTWLGNMLEDHPGQPSYHFVPYELGAFK